MKYGKLILVVLAVALMAIWGCERKVTNEIVQQNNGLDGAEACMECHGDNDLALAAAQSQWANSKHASGETTILNANVGDGNCERCHTAEGFIAYITGVPFDSSHYSSIGCFTCHAPHTTGTLELRWTDPVTLANGFSFDHGDANLCANCHQSRRNVTTYVADSVKLSERFGPHHSNQGDMLAGTGGYEYADYTYENSPHTNVAAEGCINCHMAPSVGVELGGHTWTMAAETVEGEMLNVVGCNKSTCHSPALEDFNFEGRVDETEAYLDSLGAALYTAGLASYVIDSAVTPYDTTYAPKANKIVKHKDSSGAVYNYMFVKEDRSDGVHNTEYALGLLQSALNYLRSGSSSAAKTEVAELYSAH
jgi:hypothetical protein